METGLRDSHDRHFAISPATGARRDRVERQFLAKVYAMSSYHLTAADGVERAAYDVVDELRAEGMRCEHMLLALKALVAGSAEQPHVLISELVPRCIVHYYETPRPRPG